MNHCGEVMLREVTDLGEKTGGLETASTHLQATTRPASHPACYFGKELEHRDKNTRGRAGVPYIKVCSVPPR